MAVMFQTGIRNVVGSNAGLGTDYPELFVVFLSPFREMYW
jgi:hypothetical protein